MVTETELYEQATTGMNERARYKLANYMAHGYELVNVTKVTFLKRGENNLMINDDGQMHLAKKVF